MAASYTKLHNGTWGIRVKGSTSQGATVEVTTKAGVVKTETVQRVLWSGNGTSICAITYTPRASKGASRGKWTGCACGSIEDNPRDSDCFTCQLDA
jgi:hypothetical protein